MTERLVIDGRGTEKIIRPSERVVFSDKKASVVDEESILRHLTESQRIYKEMEVGQREATVELNPQYPDLPVFIWLNCDSHIGSKMVDYDAFLKDYNIVKNTPNFFCLSNGDEIDHFMVNLGRASVGAYETPITPGQQAKLVQSLFRKLDEQDKMLAFSFGNHNQWLRGSGYKFENTWLADFKCPVLNCGGLLKANYGGQEYRIAMTHQYWGQSKLNPTNAAKRYWEHEFPSADVIFLGHTHQAEFLFFKRDQETDYRYGIIGGTYKVDDEWPQEHGYGTSHLGGFVLKLQPGRRDIEILRSAEEAQEYFELLRKLPTE